MSDDYEFVSSLFHQRIESIAGAVDAMAPGLEIASASVMQALLEDRKVLILGCGSDGELAKYAASALREPRKNCPPIPAMALSSVETAGSNDEIWRDLRTLSRDGDVVLGIDTGSEGENLQRVSEIAHERNLVAIGLSEFDDTRCHATIKLQDPDAIMRRELALMAIHSLQSLIRRTLVGE